MSLSQLSFPVLCVSQGTIAVENSEETLTTCTKTALKNGWYKQMLIVDSSGLALRLRGANKLRGVGLFRGYNIFLNQRIRVKLEPESDPYQITIDAVKELLLGSFKKRCRWSSRGDFEELTERVKCAQSTAEIICQLY